MNKLLKVIFGIVFTFLFAFTGIGYAALSQEFEVRGYMSLSELNAIYIVSVEQVESSQGSSVSNISFTNTVLTSNITLNNSDPNAYVTLEITVKNNTDNMEAGFNDFITSSSKIEYTSERYSISNLKGIHHMDTKLSPGEYRTFRVTINYLNNTISSVSNLKDVLQIDFIPWSISGANAVFEELLNNNFSALDNIMNSSSGRDNSYVSNVEGAKQADKDFIISIFEGNMSTFVPNKDGELEETEMKIFIKRANVDGNTATGDANGDEYILFMTSETLEKGTFETKQAVVYACAYTRFSQDQDYVMVGEMFEGKAKIVSYAGGWLGGFGDGSFTTDSWTSSKDYYGIPAGSGDTDEQETCGNLGSIVAAAIAQGAYEKV